LFDGRARRRFDRPVRDFNRLWAAYAVSAGGTWLAFDAFAVIAVLVLHSPPPAVSALAAVGPAVGALIAVPVGPWVEFRRRRPVLVATDLVRAAALLSLPAAFLAGVVGLAQLVAVSAVVAAADIVFAAASGAYLKTLVAPDRMLLATSRFESTTWTATVLGPPLGGAAIGLFGPLVTVVLNAASFVASAGAIRTIRGPEPPPPRRAAARLTREDLLAGWRHVLTHPRLRPLFLNSALNNALIMTSAPLMAVLMLGELGFPPWQYGLAFGAPCVGGLLGARLSRALVARYGTPRVLRVAGTLRACWPVGLAFVGAGPGGLALVAGLQFGLVLCNGVFGPVLAAHRLELTGPELTVRTLSAWSVATRATIAVVTALWGLLAGLVGVREAVAAAGVLLLATPLLLPRAGGAASGGRPTRFGRKGGFTPM
jgi:MFS transporter